MDGKFHLSIFNKGLTMFIITLNEERKIRSLIAPENFKGPEGLNIISISDFFSEVQKIDSPKNSLGYFKPMSVSTVGATSLREA